MKPLTAETAAVWSGGTLVQGEPGTLLCAVSTDTRSIPAGALFIALTGERHDAHDYLEQAVQAGAGALLVSRRMDYPAGVPVIRVDDTLAGLQRLARHCRRDWGGKVIGLTGSNGKTSTKDLTRSVLSRRWRVNATKGNLNNHIGLPLTILDTAAEDEMAVCEMGMNHPGEIAPLAAIAAPDVAIITNIGTAHIEHMGSRAAIALEKGMLAEAVSEEGCVVLNANDEYTPSIRGRCRGKVITAGIDAGDVRVCDLQGGDEGSRFVLYFPDGQEVAVNFPVPGRHMAGNAALAAAAAWHLGLSPAEIATGLESATLTKGRLQPRTVAGLRFIDDSYNANPDSMRAALETVQSMACAGRRIAVLGRMGELGPHAEPAHLELGRQVFAHGFSLLCTVGTGDAELIARGCREAGAAAGSVHTFADHAACAAFLKSTARPEDLILLKGSRSAAMEKVTGHLND